MFSLINIKAENIAPIVLIVAAAIGGYYLWTRAKVNNAAASTSSGETANVNANAATVATLRALFTGSNAPAAAPSASPTYSAPLATPNAAPVGNGSSTGNGSVTQGI